MNKYLPEGSLINTAENRYALRSVSALEQAMRSGKILEARASVCTGAHDLIVDLPCAKGIIPREEADTDRCNIRIEDIPPLGQIFHRSGDKGSGKRRE